MIQPIEDIPTPLSKIAVWRPKPLQFRLSFTVPASTDLPRYGKRPASRHLPMAWYIAPAHPSKVIMIQQRQPSSTRPTRHAVARPTQGRCRVVSHTEVLVIGSMRAASRVEKMEAAIDAAVTRSKPLPHFREAHISGLRTLRRAGARMKSGRAGQGVPHGPPELSANLAGVYIPVVDVT